MATTLPEDRAESVFSDFKPAYSQQAAEAEANRCLYCLDAPCIAACPTAINIPEFIRKIGTGNIRGAAKTIFDSNILGMSCARGSARSRSCAWVIASTTGWTHPPFRLASCNATRPMPRLMKSGPTTRRGRPVVSGWRW